MAVSPSTLQKLIGDARHVGHVSVDDLRKAFPIDTMAADDIAAIITRLEDENISVEIDAALLSLRHGVRPVAIGVSSSEAEQLTLDRDTTSLSAQTAGSVGTPPQANKNKQYNGSDRVADGASRGMPSSSSIAWLLLLVLAAITFMGIWLTRT